MRSSPRSRFLQVAKACSWSYVSTYVLLLNAGAREWTSTAALATQWTKIDKFIQPFPGKVNIAMTFICPIAKLTWDPNRGWPTSNQEKVRKSHDHPRACFHEVATNSQLSLWELPDRLFWHCLQSNLRVWLFLKKSLVVFKILDLTTLVIYWVSLRRFCMPTSWN